MTQTFYTNTNKAYVIEDWDDIQHHLLPGEALTEKPVFIEKDPDSLLLWIYQDADYLALMDAYPGRVASFERAIAENRLAVAQALWDGFTVSPELIAKLSQKLPEFGYQDLLERLYPSPI